MTIHALNIRSVLNNPPPILDFVLPGLLAGTVGMIVGPGAVGKTTFLLQLAMAVAAGNSISCGLPFKTIEPGKVVLVAAEETLSMLSHRLHSIHRCVLAELGDSVQGLVNPSEVMQSWEKNLLIVPASGTSHHLAKGDEPSTFFRDLCVLAADARLIIVDPLRRLHGGDENDSAGMTEVVQLLEGLARKTGAAVLVAHHANKNSMSGMGSASTASRGSSALTDGVRWQLNLSQAPDDKKANKEGTPSSVVKLEFVKTNYLAPQKPLLFKRTSNGVLVVGASAIIPAKAKTKPKEPRASDDEGATYY
jgi:regulatory protein RepA